MACYYIVISSTHLRDGQLRSIKGVFRGPIGTTGQRSTVRPRVRSLLGCERDRKARLKCFYFEKFECVWDSNLSRIFELEAFSDST